jgi:hypothetical protein
VLSQITENRKVWTRKPLIFQRTIFGFCLEKAILRQSHWSCLWQPGFAQTFKHVGVIFWPHPWRARADIHLEGRWRDRDSLLQRFLRFFGAIELAAGSGEPTVSVGIIRVRPDSALCGFDCGFVFSREIQSQRDLI